MPEVLAAEIGSTDFRFYTSAELRAISVKQIISSATFDARNNPLVDGLYDPALGPQEQGVPCETCGQTSKFCNGHLGHIELIKPVCHPLLFNDLYTLLRLKCFFCHRLRLGASEVRKHVLKLALLDAGRWEDALGVDAAIASEVDKRMPKGGGHKDIADGFWAYLNGDRNAEVCPPADGGGAAEGATPKDRKAAVASDVTSRLLAAHGDALSAKGCAGAQTLHVRELRRAARKEFIDELARAACAHCNARSPGLRKDATKIFRRR